MQASAKPLCTLTGHSDEVVRLEFSSDGKLLASADENCIKLWNVDTGELHGVPEDQDDFIFDMAFSPYSKFIASVVDEGTARIWDTKTCQIEHIMSVEDERMLALAFSPSGRILATTSEVVRLWNTSTGSLNQVLIGPGDKQTLSLEAMWHRNEYPIYVNQVEFSPSGKKLASACCGTNTVRIWDVGTWTLEHSIQAQTTKFSPDGLYLMTTINHNAVLHFHDMATWELQSTVEGGGQRSFSPTFSPDGQLIALHHGHDIALRNIKDGSLLHLLVGHERKVHSTAFSPDGKVLVSSAGRRDIKIFDIETAESLSMIKDEDVDGSPSLGRFKHNLGRVLFHDDGARLALALPDGRVWIWHLTWTKV